MTGRGIQLITLLAAGWAATCARAGITPGQVDDFQDGTTMGWIEGFRSPNPPGNLPDGGPLGAGDNYLQNISTGGFGPGSRVVMFNQSQWTGDYLAAGITGIDAHMANFGDAPLFMRITLADNIGNVFGTADAHVLPPDGNWYDLSFAINAADMASINGSATLDALLAGVIEIRVLSSSSGPSFTGDAVAATLGMDNVTAVPEPGSLALAAMAAAALLRRRTRTQSPTSSV